jgi:hypothetical protein
MNEFELARLKYEHHLERRKPMEDTQLVATNPVIGCIKHWKQHAGPLHFFVAWWLDTDTL